MFVAVNKPVAERKIVFLKGMAIVCQKKSNPVISVFGGAGGLANKNLGEKE